LPYIDEHSIQIGATREHVWHALVVRHLLRNVARRA